MAYTPKKLAAPLRPANTTANTMATVPAAKSWIVKQIIVANTTASSASLSIALVPSGGSEGVGNRIASVVPLAGNSLTTFDIAQVLNTGDFISVTTSVASALTFHASGVEFD